MAAPLKNSFGPTVAVRIADLIGAVQPDFPAAEFVAAATGDFDTLELADRSRAIAAALRDFLPGDPAAAISLITQSLPSGVEAQRWQGMDSFMLWPFTMFIAENGLDCFEESMAAQYEITQLFTAEFSIRSFIDQRHVATMARLHEWTTDPSEHVRRLVSEGTRPRLPWASRLQRFVDDPAPVLPLLESLRDDPSEYVRRSVANNLNDIAKDHPATAIATCERWLSEQPGRRPMVRHALRTLVKAGDPRALALLGFDQAITARILTVEVIPQNVRIGESVEVLITLLNPGPLPAQVLVDFEVVFARPGTSGRKVFKGAELQVEPGAEAVVRRRLSMRQMSTRRVYPGPHRVVALLNGVRHEGAGFAVSD